MVLVSGICFNLKKSKRGKKPFFKMICLNVSSDRQQVPCGAYANISQEEITCSAFGDDCFIAFHQIVTYNAMITYCY